MDNQEFKKRVLEALPYEVMDVEKKAFFTLSYGQGGYVWFVEKGLLMSLRNTSKDRYKGIGLYDINSILGVGGFNSPKRDMPCFALAQSRLCYVQVNDFQKLMSENLDLCFFMMNYISETLLKTFRNLEISSLGTLEEQIIAFEKSLGDMVLPEDANISELVLSMAVGAHPVSVCRVRKRLRQKYKSLSVEEK